LEYIKLVVKERKKERKKEKEKMSIGNSHTIKIIMMYQPIDSMQRVSLISVIMSLILSSDFMISTSNELDILILLGLYFIGNGRILNDRSESRTEKCP
jgi:hypothetical protein